MIMFQNKYQAYLFYVPQFSAVQSLSHVRFFATPWTENTRLSCPTPTPRAYSNSCPSSQWCHPTISPSVSSFSSPRQSFPPLRSSLVSQFFISGGQSIGISPSNEYSGLISFRIDWLDLLAVQGTLKSLSNTIVQKHELFITQLFYSPTLTLIYDYWKKHNFDIWTVVAKVVSLLFNMLSRLVVAFLLSDALWSHGL